MCSEGKKQTNTFWNSGLFLSADLLPETESSRDELVCLRGGDVCVYIRARLTWMFESERRERRVGVTVLDIMSWDRKTGHRVGFIRITLTSNICFGRDLLHLKVDILSFLYIYVSCIWGEYSRRFRLFYLRVCEERWQRQSRQRSHPVYFINFRKAHYFVVIMTIQK